MLNNFFYNDWLDYRSIFDQNRKIYFTTNLQPDFFADLKFDQDSLRTYAIESAKNLTQHLGSKIALCFSGGLDSQFMIKAFEAAKIDFDIYILSFDKNLNNQDSDHAIKFCTQHNLKYNVINFNVVEFLNYKNHDVGIRYKSASPHFNVHYEMFNILRKKGYTGIVCGGIYPLNINDYWGNNLAVNTLNFINYSTIENFYVQGSFLSYCPKLAWALGVITGKVTFETNLNFSNENQASIDEKRLGYYALKIKAFEKFNFDLIPQDAKYTGFENVKLYYQKLTNDGWFFEKTFRYPLQSKFQEKLVDNKILHLTSAQHDSISQVQRNYMLTSL